MVLSTLLGTRPPVMRVDRLVRACAIFGITSGAARTAISRMTVAGELVAEGNGRYSLAGGLVERQSRQEVSRAGSRLEWNGRWRMAVVRGRDGRDRNVRAELRRAASRLRLAELREGAWIRPDNLIRPSGSVDAEFVDGQCQWFDVAPDREDELLELWPLGDWTDTAGRLRREMSTMRNRLSAEDRSALAEGFVLSASVLRHFNADPLLPRELLPRRWPGDLLRGAYDEFDATYRRALASWLGAEG